MHQVSERQLHAVQLCPLGSFPGEDRLESVLSRSIAEGLVHAMERPGSMDPKRLRDLMGARWQVHKGAVDSRTYLHGHELIAFAAKTAGDILRDYKVLIPVAPYALRVGDFTVEVNYAVVRKWRTDGPDYCLSMQRSRPRRNHNLPSLAALARWAHMQNQYPQPVPILHLPVIWGKPWFTSGWSLPLVARQLERILKATLDPEPYFRVGPHCDGCLRRRCMEETCDR